MEDVLKTIRDYADAAHGTQMRKYTPERYIVHPERVMQILKEYTTSLPMLAAALLHDVLEDTPVTREEMHAFLCTQMSESAAEETLRLVVELTDVYVKEDYPAMNRKERKRRELQRLEGTSADSQTIKYADILDNCREIVRYDRNFARVFLGECRLILSRLTRGNRELLARSREVVGQSIIELRSK